MAKPGQTRGRTQKQRAQVAKRNRINIDNPTSVIAAQNRNIRDTLPLSTPNISDYRGSRTVDYDPQGRPTVTTELSGRERDLYEGDYNVRDTANRSYMEAANRGREAGPFNGGFNDPRSGLPTTPEFSNSYGTSRGYNGPTAATVGNFKASTGGDVGVFKNNLGKINNFNGGFNDPRLAIKTQLPQDFSREREKVFNNTLDAYDRRAGKEQNRQFEQLNQQLLNMGHAPGSEQYSRAMEEFQTNWQDRNLDTTARAYSDAGAESSRMFSDALAARSNEFGENYNSEAMRFGNSLAGYNANLNARNTAFNENTATYDRNMARNESLFNRGLAGYNANLAGADMRFSHGMAANDSNNRAIGDNFNRGLATAEYGLNRRNSIYNENFNTENLRFNNAYTSYMAPHNVAAMYQPAAGGYTGPNYGGIQPINVPITDIPGLAGTYRGHNYGLRSQQISADASRYGADASAGASRYGADIGYRTQDLRGRQAIDQLGYANGLGGGLI